MQPRATCGQYVTFSLCKLLSMSSVGKDGEERWFGGVARAWTSTVQGLVKTNLATYRTQKVADSWVADGTVFIMHRQLFNASPICVKTTHDKPGRVLEPTEVSRSLDLIPTSCRHTWPVYCNLVIKLVKSAKWCCSMLLALAPHTMFYTVDPRLFGYNGTGPWPDKWNSRICKSSYHY